VIDLENFWVSEEQIRTTEAARAAKDSKGKPQPRKESKVGFLKLSLAFLHKLKQENANGDVYATVWALSVAWFTTGIHTQHPNPFPLSTVDTRSWGLDRRRKHEALKFLIRVRLIDVDRRDPKNPLVTIAWEPQYPPQASA
jgi:hypothetical protein